MSEQITVQTIEGARATVDVVAVLLHDDIPTEGGTAQEWGLAWQCRTCTRHAGMPPGTPGGLLNNCAPFDDVKLPSGEELTAHDFAVQAATAHAEKVCAGR